MAKPDPTEDAARLEDQIATLRADLARIAETLVALGHGSRLGEAAEALRAEGSARLAEAGHSAEAALQDVTDYARQKPVQALAIAGGLGLLLGLLLGRR